VWPLRSARRALTRVNFLDGLEKATQLLKLGVVHRLGVEKLSAIVHVLPITIVIDKVRVYLRAVGRIV